MDVLGTELVTPRVLIDFDDLLEHKRLLPETPECWPLRGGAVIERNDTRDPCSLWYG